LQIKQPDGLLQVSFLSSAEYMDGSGYVELCFDPKLKPFLLQLKECFTTYDIRNVLSLKSAHSIRMYELLKQYEPIGSRTIDVDELKHMLGVDQQYASYNLFKKRVILQAQKDLEENTDLSFTFEEVKESRRVAKLQFFIRRKQRTDNKLNSEKAEVVEKLLEMGIERKHALRYVQIKDLDAIRSSIEYTKKQYKVKKIHSNLGGYLKALLDNEATLETEYEKKQKQEADEKQKSIEKQRKQIQELKEEFQSMRSERLNKLFAAMTDEEKQQYFNSRNRVEKMMIFDEKGNLKENMAYGLLRSHLARENGLEDNDETFKLWVRENKGFEMAQELREGNLEWVIIGEQLSLLSK
ncbi:MAG: replication initiation protein, partial [Candidatus Caenarcaniphilales bacterium]|nr:replication initiation protein [Candidatus Caenarcaniphilales bacterium]